MIRTLATTVCAIACAAFLSTAHAGCIGGDSFSTHKALHAVGNAAIVYGTDAAIKRWAPDTFEAHPYLGIAPAVVASAFVELRKYKTPGEHCEYSSMAYDAAGIAIGAAGTRWLLIPEQRGLQVAYSAQF